MRTLLQTRETLTVWVIALVILSCDSGSFVEPDVPDVPDNPAARPVVLTISGLDDQVVAADTVRLSALVLNQYSQEMSVNGLEWNSSNPNVARLEPTGANGATLTANSPGTTTITVSYANLAASVDLEVHNRPVDLKYVSGSGQSAAGGQTLPDALVVVAEDRRGDLISGVSVRFEILEGGGSVSTTAVLTDDAGRATTDWTLGAAGPQQVRAVADPNQARVKNMKDSVVVFTATAIADVASLNVTPATATVAEGDSLELHVSASASDGGNLGDPGVHWESSDTSIASISSKGVLRGRAGGKAVATASYASTTGEVKDSAEITVTAETRTITAIEIDPPTAIVDTGSTVMFRATGILSDGSTTAAAVAWSATGGSIDVDGLFTAGNEPGTFQVVATHTQGPADTAEVSVLAPEPDPARVAISPSAVAVEAGFSVQFTSQAFDADGGELTDVAFSWTSTDTEVATVSSSGRMTGKTAGAALIIVAATGLADTASVTVEPSTTSAPSPAGSGIWISAEEIASLPTSGAAWEAVLSDAGRSFGTANISDQDSKHDNYTLAAALVCARTGQYCQKALDGILDAVGTEGGRWLAVSRNLGAYVIAADVLHGAGYANSTVDAWIAEWPTRLAPENNSGGMRTIEPFASGSNASAQEGFVAAALGAYLNDQALLDRTWEAYRTFVCDPGATDPENINLARAIEYNWTDPDHPCAVNPLGSTRVVEAGLPGAGERHRLDGSVGNDMRRGGQFQWPPGWTQYPWTGLAGLVPAALVLYRAGYPAFEVADRAVLRTHDYMWFLRTETGNTDWFDGDRGGSVVQLVNYYYGTTFPVAHPAQDGHTIAYTDWTHTR